MKTTCYAHNLDSRQWSVRQGVFVGMVLLTVAALSGCVSSFTDQMYIPSSRPEVGVIRATLSPEQAIDFISPYIRAYAEKDSQGLDALGAPFGAQLDPASSNMVARMRKPTITLRGFRYANGAILSRSNPEGLAQGGGPASLRLFYKDISFRDITKVTLRCADASPTATPKQIVASTASGEALVCDIGDKPHLVNRCLAAIEVLCPHLQQSTQALQNKPLEAR